MLENEEVFLKIKNWSFLSELNTDIEGFSLDINSGIDGDKINIFTYKNEQQQDKVIAFYNCATKDFMVRKVFGLNDYCDIKFITPRLDIFEQNLKNDLNKELKEMNSVKEENLSWTYRRKGLYEWSFEEFLPDTLLGFTLYINPKKPIKIINGSFIIADYSDFENESQFILYYNELRDEFYAEKKLFGTIYPLNIFHVNTIKELESSLKKTLYSFMETFREEIIQNKR